jgi:hypothetical protein
MTLNPLSGDLLHKHRMNIVIFAFRIWEQTTYEARYAELRSYSS